MKILLIVFLALVSCLSCSDNKLVPENKFLGEWHYVGTLDIKSTNKCLICTNYELESSPYYLIFKDDNTYSGRINLLITEGKYVLINQKKIDNKIAGEFKNIDFRILNKPFETAADSKFKILFEQAEEFEIINKNTSQIYDILNLSTSKSDEYLQFVRKEN
jgi:lipocalin